MIKLQELSDYLASYLNVHEFKDYCTNGIQLRGKEGVKKIAFSTSASLNIIDQTIKNNADVLIVHHGLFWDKDSKDIDGVIKDKLFKLLKADVSVLCYHLPLDAHKVVGNNYQTLRRLGFKDIKPFDVIGSKSYEECHVDTLIESIKREFKVSPIIPPVKKNKIQSIACVTGGGHSYLKQAHKEGIDALITGTCDEWVWDFAQENNMLFVPMGHYSSETIGIQSLMKHVEESFNVDVVYLENFNPY